MQKKRNESNIPITILPAFDAAIDTSMIHKHNAYVTTVFRYSYTFGVSDWSFL